jgi:hypothetical protein
LIGSARRECTDHILVFNEEHLRRILSKFITRYAPTFRFGRTPVGTEKSDSACTALSPLRPDRSN